MLNLEKNDSVRLNSVADIKEAITYDLRNKESNLCRVWYLQGLTGHSLIWANRDDPSY